jgi:hypothetical protein
MVEKEIIEKLGRAVLSWKLESVVCVFVDGTYVLPEVRFPGGGCGKWVVGWFFR